MTNGLLEGINGLVQAAKRKARGYRTTDNFIAMIYAMVIKSHNYSRFSYYLDGKLILLVELKERVSVWSHVSLATKPVPLSRL